MESDFPVRFEFARRPRFALLELPEAFWSLRVVSVVTFDRQWFGFYERGELDRPPQSASPLTLDVSLPDLSSLDLQKLIAADVIMNPLRLATFESGSGIVDSLVRLIDEGAVIYT